MKNIFIIWIVLFLVNIETGRATYVSDVQSEKEIVLLEFQLQSRINQVIKVVFDDLNFHTSVSLKLDERKSSVEKNMENNDLDYLPLIIKDQANSERNILRIESYDVRIVSPSSISNEMKNQIKELIQGELRGKKYSINFIQVGQNGFWTKTQNFFKNVFIDNITNWLMLVMVAGFVFFGYQLYKRRILLTKTHMNVINHSNVEELVKFLRAEISKNKDVLKNIVKEEKNDLIGLKSLMPYLQIQFSPDEIFRKSTLIRMEQENGFYTEVQFGSWLKEFSERISTQLIKSGNSPMIKRPEETILAGLKNMHMDVLVKTLKEINDVSTYAVIFYYLDESYAKTIATKFERPVWSDLSPNDLYELNHEHIIKNVISRSKKFMEIDVVKVTDEKTKSTDDMIAQVFAAHGKNVKLAEAKPDKLDESLNMFAQKLETGNKTEEVKIGEKPEPGKVTDDMINQLLKARDNKKNVSVAGPSKFEWNRENIIKLPQNYVTKKFESRTAEEIATLLHGLPKSTRYFIISHIPQEKVNTIMMVLESIDEDGKSSEAVSSFLKEVSSDYSEGLFQLNEKKAA